MSNTVRRRNQDAALLQYRAAEGESTKPQFRGYAVVFNEWTTLLSYRNWEIREVIRPGAFRNALAASQDVRALINHDSTLVLGRTRAGTLRLREDDKGLAVEIDPPNTQPARDIAVSMERGDVNQMSFAFLPRKGGEVTTIRMVDDVEVTEIEIVDADLFDVAVVTYPAYEGTSIGVRGRDIEEAAAAAKRRWLAERLAKLDSLNKR
ncbi:HK97 family phage prohead protease [Paludisphaera rhizosphaerae]|uniref:HK97 family phage prohead protease n=1 Tax=Paludisphaera rhizosphaerae TaxID=2711216 RepID=UPI0013EC6CFE|nr:HK97 family phage prohead protease [Paludisphaera rhizosphaerae]